MNKKEQIELLDEFVSNLGKQDLSKNINIILQDFKKHKGLIDEPVNGWYISDIDNMCFFKDNKLQYWINNNGYFKSDSNRNIENTDTPATPEQVNEVFKKYIEKHYVGKRVKCLFDGEEYVVEGFDEIDFEGDVIANGDFDVVYLFKKGTWATIIEEEVLTIKIPKGTKYKIEEV